MPYPEYTEMKDSGIEWLGKIPEHWKEIQLLYLFKIESGGTPESANMDYWNGEIIWVTPEDLSEINSKKISDSKRKLSESGLSNSSATLVEKGSLIVSKRAPIGYIAIADDYLATNQGCYSLIRRGANIDSNFFYYQLLALKKYLKSLGQGSTFTELYRNEIKEIKLLSPPYKEQKSIANFLDQETEKIDKLIEKKEKLIDLLEEKRQAMISEAVTKGLNPDVPMKDSGIEWLGKIPEHWETVKIKWLYEDIGSGTTPTSSNTDYYNGEIPWVNTTELNNCYINKTNKSITRKALQSYSTLKLYPENTLLVALYGATIGKLGILNMPATVNQACCALNEPKDKTNIKFIYYWLLSNRKNILSYSYGGGQQNISQNTVKNLKITMPPFEEQKSISNFLDKKTAKIDNLISKTQNQIDNLKEYRKTLISKAVTGKIDVRDLA
ncbi:restriction endonuclease subunit S [Halarsenatibacter silvermanii]|uniref:Type I restriction enzyme, S subunit n=1 Tax=Halarsenatibacter silvermanii TaxID=321763 RepID=A0A1G9KTA6_9FIRM|nr:restriction endonuclease subunit S [Halarsenatibacter silvermanii]SDL52951.1 type I restriction enzyme, S subunit [Halarsenatibacter silvermanii]